MLSKKEKEDLAANESMLNKAWDEIENLKQERAELQHELAKYRTAVAAVKWLWDQASLQRPFEV